MRDAQRIVDRVRAAGVVIVGFGDAPPVSTSGIAFDGDDSEELDGESFVISPTLDDLPRWDYDEHGVVRAFCKTERFPYDLAVTAVLLRCTSLAPNTFLLHSDGEWTEEWLRDATYPPTGLSSRGLVTDLFGECPTESPFSSF